MAKGKEALQAERRKYEAALTHAQRLTDELVDYKLRTRACEADARRVPKLVAEIEHLNELVERGSSDELDRLRARKDAEIAEHFAENERLRTLFRTFMERLPDGSHVFTEEDQEFIRSRSLTKEFFEGYRPDANRQLRRHAARGGRNVGTIRQDNLRTWEENVGWRRPVVNAEGPYES